MSYKNNQKNVTHFILFTIVSIVSRRNPTILKDSHNFCHFYSILFNSADEIISIVINKMSYKNKQKNVTHFIYSQLFQLFQEKIQQY